MIKIKQSFFVSVGKTLLSLVLSGLVFVTTPAPVMAASCRGVLAGPGTTLPAYQDGDTHTVKIDMNSYDKNQSFYLKVKNTSGTDDEAQTPTFKIDRNGTYQNGDGTVTVRNGVVTWVITDKEALESAPLSGENDTHFIKLYDHGAGSNVLCDVGTYETTKNTTGGKCALYVSQSRTVGGQSATCYSSGCLDTATTDTKIEVEKLEDNEGKPFNGKVRFVIKGGSTPDKIVNASNGKASTVFAADNETNYEIKVEIERTGNNFDFAGCSTSFTAVDKCSDDTCDEIRTDVSGNALVKNFELCEQVTPDDIGKCQACFGGESYNGQAGVWTAIGCIPAKPDSIIKTFITIGLSIGGGATFLLILAGAFRLSVSQGDPQATKDAKEQISSAIIGLVFIIFSITMLRFIGVNLFQIPGFGG